MERGWWRNSVSVQISAATTVNVNNTVQAGRLLLGEWPGEPGEKLDAAKRAVLAALGAPTDPARQEKARRAFRAAAAEAGILRNG